MKIHFSGNKARAIAATMRNCLTRERAPQACPVRKCRRDGCCTGPLVCLRDEQIQLAPGPGVIGSGSLPLPICWLALTDAQEASIRTALCSHLRALDRHVDSTVVETTRALSGRRWKRLLPLAEDGADAGQP